MKNGLIIGTLLSLFSISSMAIEITVTQRPGCSLVTVCDDIDDAIRAELQDGLPDTNFGNFATGMANANSFSQAGLSSDYSDKFSTAFIKFGVGTALQADTDGISNFNSGDGENNDILEAEGFGIGAAATFGINLNVFDIDKFHFIDFSKLDLFVSLGLLNRSQSEDDIELDAKISHFSIMGRYQLIEAKEFVSPNILKWGGLFLHTGIQRSSFTADIMQSIDGDTVDVGGGQTATISDTSIEFDLKTTTTTIPIELSTYMRTIWALTFFGGTGFDLVFGKTEAELRALGVASGNGVTSSYVADITASDSEDGKADPTNFRAFAGIQVNLPYVRIYTQLNKGLGNDLVGANLGLKVLW